MRVAQLCPTLCNPVDYIVHGILWARILEWIALNTGVGSLIFSSGSSQPRDRTQVFHIAGRFFTSLATGKPNNTGVGSLSPPADLLDPGMEPGSLALQVDSLPTEL